VFQIREALFIVGLCAAGRFLFWDLHGEELFLLAVLLRGSFVYLLFR